MRGRAAWLAAKRACRGAAALFRDVPAMDVRSARPLLRALAFAGERDAGAARLRQSDGDRLLRAACAMLALADLVELLAYEFARHGAGGLSLPRLAAGAFQCAFFRHGGTPATLVPKPKPWRAAPCAMLRGWR